MSLASWRVAPIGLLVWLAIMVSSAPPTAAAVLVPRGAWRFAAAPAAGRTWPLAPPHTVLRRFEPPATRWGAGHRGVDLAGAAGDPVFAPAAGVVSFAGMVAGRPVLVVEHQGGVRSTLEPVESALPLGSSVLTGASVGHLAEPIGHCPGASCLHWGVLRGETYLDPLAWLRGRVILLPVSPP